MRSSPEPTNEGFGLVAELDLRTEVCHREGGGKNRKLDLGVKHPLRGLRIHGTEASNISGGSVDVGSFGEEIGCGGVEKAVGDAELVANLVVERCESEVAVRKGMRDGDCDGRGIAEEIGAGGYGARAEEKMIRGGGGVSEHSSFGGSGERCPAGEIGGAFDVVLDAG